MNGGDLVLTAHQRPIPPLRFRLWEEPDGAERVTVRLTPVALPLRHEFFRVRFPPLPDSAGRALAFSVEAEGPDGGRVVVWGRAAGDPYPDGSALDGGSPRAGDLAFRAMYRVTPWEALGILGRRLTVGRPAPLKWPAAYLVLAALYVGTMALFLARALVGSDGRQGSSG